MGEGPSVQREEDLLSGDNSSVLLWIPLWIENFHYSLKEVREILGLLYKLITVTSIQQTWGPVGIVLN